MKSDKILQIGEGNDLYSRIEESGGKCPNCDSLSFDIHNNFCLNPDCLYNLTHNTITKKTKLTIENITNQTNKPETNILFTIDPYDQKRPGNY